MSELIHIGDEDVNDADLKIYESVVEVAGRYGVDPSMSLDSENFFNNLLAQYTGDLENLMAWLEEQIPQHFAVFSERPRWIQDPEWPFADGKPMTFVGQIDLSPQQDGIVSELLHDDTSLYVFIGKGVRPAVVIQQC